MIETDILSISFEAFVAGLSISLDILLTLNFLFFRKRFSENNDFEFEPQNIEQGSPNRKNSARDAWAAGFCSR